MHKRTNKILLIILFIVVILALHFSPIRTVLTFENLKQHRDSLLAFVQARYWMSVASFIAFYAVLTSFSLPVALILTLAGGFLFGTATGVLYIVIGATTGATLAFLMARYLLGDWLQIKYQTQLIKFNEEIKRNGNRYLLTLRLIPIFPFFVINFLAGLTQVPIRTFVWTTALGMIPATAVFAFAGRQLGTIATVSDIVSKKTFLSIAALGLMVLIPVIYKQVSAKGKADN